MYCILGLSEEALHLLETQGVNISSVSLLIPDSFSFPVYKNLLRTILYYCFLHVCERSPLSITVNAREEDGKMLLVFLSTDGTLQELFENLSEDKLFPAGNTESDETFLNQVMQRFVLSALKQQSSTLHYYDSDQGSCFVITFEPAVITEQKEDRKTVLLLEDKDEMIWLISDLLSDEYVVHPVKSIQQAFDEMHKYTPALFLVDMLMYADAESTFMEFVNKYRSLLSKTAFIPMLTWKASSSIQRELVLWADSYIVLPYDILFLKETIYKVIYGKQEAKQIYMEELSGWTDSFVCTTNEQADFIRKFLQVVERNLNREDLGSTFVAEQMAISPRQFYRKFKEISGVPPSDLIKRYRMEKAAKLLLDESLSIQDVILDVGISSRSYFYKEFTRRFGMTPKDYREQHK